MAENFISSVSSEEFDKALLGGLDAASGKFAKKEDIPTVPVQSVNGKTGEVTVDTIIDVIALPETDIDDKALYRLLTGTFVYNQLRMNGYTCVCVNGLPETGEPVTNADMTEIYAYYNVQDGICYGYVDDALSAALGVPVGWYDLGALLGAVGVAWGGTITNIADDPNDGTLRLLLEYVLYSYKNVWTSMKSVGRAGEGLNAEAFNAQSNIAIGENSHAEGVGTTASGDFGSHAEGVDTTASGDSGSHAEGVGTTASGDSGSHSEGFNTTASGDYGSHAEGIRTKASGFYGSHAEGLGAVATSRSQHVQGTFNQYDKNEEPDNIGRYLHIVGNGTSDDDRSNAHTLDWDGNAWFAGEVYVGSTSGKDKDEGSKKLATVDEVAEAAAAAKTEIVQATGDSESAVMSQKAVTDAIESAGAPAYVTEEAERVATETLAVQNENTFSFLALSDLHYLNTETENAFKIQAGDKHAGQGAEYVMDLVHCDFAAVLGDNIYGYQETKPGAIAEHMAANRVLADRVDFRMVGNHDSNTASAMVNTTELHNLIGRFNGNDVIHGDTKIRGYFYKDIEGIKVRVIGLNTIDYIDQRGGFFLSDEQLAFFANALDLSEKSDAAEWGILILSHMPLDYDFFGEDASATYTEPSTVSVLRAYVSGTSVTAGGVTVDYNGKNAAEIIANVHGHLHNYKISTISDTAIKRICIPNACFLRNNEYGSASAYPNADYRNRFGETTTYNKTADSAEDTAFAVLTVDRSAKKIHVIYYGVSHESAEVVYLVAGPAYKNLFSTDDANFEDEMQLRSSGGTKAGTNMFVTGYIAVANGDVIRVKSQTSYSGYSGPIICGYSADKVFDSSVLVYGGNLTFTDDTKTEFSWTSKIDGLIRIGGNGEPDGFIVTKNEAIT